MASSQPNPSPNKKSAKLADRLTQDNGRPFEVDGLPKQIFLKPEVALKEAHLKPGNIVADLGCGGGYLTIPAALQVGSQGMVYAVDILKENLAGIRSQAKLYNLPNIQTIWADLEVAGSTGIADKAADVTLLFKVLCQQKNHEAIFREAVRVTKAGGLVMVAEWCEPNTPSTMVGPTKENLVSREQLLALGKSVGLQLEQEHKLDDFHYVLEYRRPT
jgi:ubiquinone/menaquinone biosynthesis C-methylase UbiE